ncbi:MAG TPA: hypothetical protein VFK38_04740 [Candidatus Limnocylindrales bacterium]|nr:hypothetical protein [Candidatus Limnocylindrales bacterium]
MPLEPPAKFFVNSGLVSSRTDVHNLLRPLIKQTVAYRYFRAGQLVGHGTGWVERIVIDQPDVSTFFTPLSICLNVDSFEHLEFETRPDQLLVYTLVQGDERLVVEFAPVHGPAMPDEPVQQTFRFEPAGYVQMELGGLEGGDAARGEPGEAAGSA